MKIQYKELAFPYIIVDDFYNEQELSEIWAELNFLTNKRKLLPPERTGSAFDPDGAFKKQNYGIFLDTLFSGNRNVSNILTHYRKIFSKEFMDAVGKFHWVFEYLYKSNLDQTLLSYYETSDYYKPHTDSATLTALTWFFKEPRNFEGGELTFTDYNETVELKNNRFILFPSIITHEVSEVVMHDGVDPMTGCGRYVVSHFIKHKL